MGFSPNFYEEDEDKGGVNVNLTLDTIVDEPVNFSLRIVERTGSNAAEGTHGCNVHRHKHTFTYTNVYEHMYATCT